MKSLLLLAASTLISFSLISSASAENKTAGSKNKESSTDKAAVQKKAEEEKKAAIERLNPAKFCTYQFQGLDDFDYKKFPSWEQLGIDKKLAKELDFTPYADNTTPKVDKDGYQDGLKRLDKGLLGLQKKDGKVVLRPIYDYMEFPQSTKSKWILCCIKERFNDTTDPRTADSGFRFMGKDGKQLSPQRFKNALSFNEGRAAVLIEGKGWGFIDETGKMVIPCHYDTVRSFCEGLATVATGYMWGYTDLKGNVVLPPIFEANTNFKKGYAKVRFNGLWGVLKRSQLNSDNYSASSNKDSQVPAKKKS